ARRRVRGRAGGRDDAGRGDPAACRGLARPDRPRRAPLRARCRDDRPGADDREAVLRRAAVRRSSKGRTTKNVAERRAEKAEIGDPEIVLGAALRFLETRPRSAVEVRRRLTSAGYRTELIEGAIERLRALGILD